MNMAIKIGEKAPEFELISDEKEVVKLSDFSGEKNVLLLFYPAAFSGVCTTELNTVNNELDYYTGRDVTVLGISTDTLFSAGEFRKANALNFSLLSDHNADACVAFGTKYEPGIFPFGYHRISRRSAFLVDKSGVVKYAEVLESAGNVPDFDAIKEAIESL